MVCYPHVILHTNLYRIFINVKNQINSTKKSVNNHTKITILPYYVKISHEKIHSPLRYKIHSLVDMKFIYLRSTLDLCTAIENMNIKHGLSFYSTLSQLVSSRIVLHEINLPGEQLLQQADLNGKPALRTNEKAKSEADLKEGCRVKQSIKKRKLTHQ